MNFLLLALQDDRNKLNKIYKNKLYEPRLIQIIDLCFGKVQIVKFDLPTNTMWNSDCIVPLTKACYSFAAEQKKVLIRCMHYYDIKIVYESKYEHTFIRYTCRELRKDKNTVICRFHYITTLEDNTQFYSFNINKTVYCSDRKLGKIYEEYIKQ